jgi:hypothetical protein
MECWCIIKRHYESVGGWSWWWTPVIPATQEAEAGGAQEFEASLGSIVKPISKPKICCGEDVLLKN